MCAIIASLSDGIALLIAADVKCVSTLEMALSNREAGDGCTAVELTDDALVVHLVDGRTVAVPLEWFPRLRDASPEERAEWRLIGRGIGIRWERLDEDISVRGLLAPG